MVSELVRLEARCVCCRAEFVYYVNREDYEAWQSGTLIQKAFPYLNDAQRELLISSVCGPCFDKMFADER